MILEALRAEADALCAALSDLEETAFATPTDCRPWTVKELSAHLLVASQRVPGMLTGPAPARAEVSARQYFSGDKLGGAHDEERIVRAQRDAAGFGAGRELVAAISGAIDETVALASVQADDRLVFTRWGEAMELSEYLKTRVFELAVHGLDVALALGCAPWTTPSAASVTVGVLLDGGARPDVQWDDLTLIAKATGREPVSEADLDAARAVLLWPRVT